MAVALVVATGVALAAEIDCTGGPCAGTNRADTMTGTPGVDDMNGRRGADTMLARGAADTLLGAGGNDDIRAGAGSDSVEGAAGDDSLGGEFGDDTYHFSIVGAGWGDDVIPAEGEGALMGTDTLDFSSLDITENLVVNLRSSAVNDEVYWTEGPDTLNFADGTVEIENVKGGDARDLISGDELPNQLVGNGGDDELSGRGNEDDLSGGHGQDAMDGGAGNDELDGGNDNDVYLFGNAWGKDSITDKDNFTGNAALGGTDRLFFGMLTSPVDVDLEASETSVEVSSGADPNLNTVDWLPSTAAIEHVVGGTVDDVLHGNSLANTLHGQGGDDEMYGEGDADTMYGRDGNDEMFGGPGFDVVYGDHPDFPAETGDDTIDVANVDANDNANDIVEAGGGNDTVIALDGKADTISCGDGTGDTVSFDETIDIVSDDCEQQNPPS
jgi:Ca2+-binding RTX toxin-like protein